MSKTVWIINQYASTPETGMGGRHFYLSQELAKLGYKVYLIAESHHHLLRAPPVMDEVIQFEYTQGFTFVWVKLPRYKQAHSNLRVLNWFLFPLRIQKLKKLIRDSPDVILCSSPSPIAFLGAQRLAKKFSCRLVFEVRDIWPLTLTEIGGYSAKHPFIRFMQKVENRAYKVSDRVVSNLENSVEHMVGHGMQEDKFLWVANGFSLDEVEMNVPLNLRAQEFIPKDGFVVGYTGSLGVANALDTLLLAALILKEFSDIKFVLVGEGNQKAVLKAIASQNGLTNVIFIDAIPKVEIQAVLRQFDACYIGWLKDDLYRFGIGANKIPEYLYSGKPILHSYSGACDPVSKYKAGLVCEAENAQALADSIMHLYKMSDEQRQAMGLNGKSAAISVYEYAALASKLESALFG